MSDLRAPGRRPSAVGVLVVATLVGPGGGCLTVELEGRPCAAGEDCLTSHACVADRCLPACTVDEDCQPDAVCASGGCLTATTPRTPATLLASDTCHRLYPPELEETASLDDIVLLGTALPVTGANAQKGADREEAVYLAVDEINQARGLGDRTLGVLSCDTASDAGVATRSLRFLWRYAGAPAVVGPAASQVVLTSFFDAEAEENLVVMSPSATSTLLKGQSEFLWRTAPNDDIQGVAIGELLAHRGYTKVAVVHGNDAHGGGLYEIIRQRFCVEGGNDRCLGGERTLIRKAFNLAGDDSDLPAIPMELAEDLPDAVVFVGEGGLVRFYFMFATDPAVRALPMILTDAAKAAALTDGEDPGLFANVIGTGPAPPQAPSYGAFATKYTTRTGYSAPPTFTPQAYDAAYLLAYAMGAAGEGEVTASAVVAGLQRLSAGPRVEVGPVPFPLAVDDLATDADATIDFAGASGPLDFPAGETEALGDIGAWVVNDAGAIVDLPGVILDAASGTFVPPVVP